MEGFNLIQITKLKVAFKKATIIQLEKIIQLANIELLRKKKNVKSR